MPSDLPQCRMVEKTDAMKHHLDSLLAENIVERSLFVDVLNPGESEADLNVVLETSDAILDFSASIAVARASLRLSLTEKQDESRFS